MPTVVPMRLPLLQHQGPEAGLDEMFVGGQRGGQLVLCHHYERDAIGQAPRLVRAPLAKSLASMEQRTIWTRRKATSRGSEGDLAAPEPRSRSVGGPPAPRLAAPPLFSRQGEGCNNF